MDIVTPDKILYFIAFFVPGFVSLRTYDLLYPTQRIEGGKRIVEAVALSCVNYAVLSPALAYALPYLQSESRSQLWVAIILVTVLLIAPVVLVLLWVKIQSLLSEVGYLYHPIDRAWDYVFSGMPKSWVKVYLKNGSIVGGLYGKRSFASSSPEPQEIFLEKIWKLNEDGGFVEEVERSSGMLIKADVISHIEFQEI